MDAKSRANFINSVAGGENIPCPKCGKLNKLGSNFCTTCGNPLVKKQEENNVPFVPVKKQEEVEKSTKEVKELVKEVKEPVKIFQTVVEDDEPESVFAQGLPEWSIEPPQVMVRRKRR